MRQALVQHRGVGELGKLPRPSNGVPPQDQRTSVGRPKPFGVRLGPFVPPITPAGRWVRFPYSGLA